MKVVNGERRIPCRRALLSLAVVLSVCLPSRPSVLAQTPRPSVAFIEFRANDAVQMREAVGVVESHGGRCTHRFPFRACVGELPPEADSALRAEALIAGLHRGPLSIGDLAAADAGTDAALAVWRETFVAQPAITPLARMEPEPPPGDMFARPRRPDRDADSGPTISPAEDQTSEFLIGSVAVAVIFPESDGGIDTSSENWSGARQNQSLSEISAALDWWASREPRAGLSFTYRVVRDVRTGYEPIAHPQSDEPLWIGQVMGRLGLTDGSYFERVETYVNDLREAYGTDWAFAVFVVDDFNDSDKRFADGIYFAYAYVGGPFLVMTYGNDRYGPTNMDAVMSHETGHIFWALDEYIGRVSCEQRSGYLDVANSNSLTPSAGACGLNQTCVMRGQIAPFTLGSLCESSRGQLGWRDTDGDGIFDPVDTDMEVTASFSRLYRAPEGRMTRTYSGRTTDRPWPSASHWPTSINVVSDVTFRIDGSDWSAATPSDGFWDEPIEEFSFELSDLTEGSHDIVVRSVNSVGNSAVCTITQQIAPPGQSSSSYLPLIQR